MNIKEKVEEMNRMIQSGQNMEAFEKYYHEDVVMQEKMPTANARKKRRNR
jgi:hypothetical protein